MAASTLNRVLKGKSAVSTEMALRLSKVLGCTPNQPQMQALIDA
ncbi:MAG: helix-turn-helix domain-containing protein [Pseudomonadaceae bacterium]|nr:helix-turn-helix domain-containing protein [Pseudomonadaceae bacterium]